MGDEYEQLKKCFDIEKQKNSNLMKEINNLKDKLSNDNSEFSRISEKTKENQSGYLYINIK
jgi:hypothetical protein